jgi:hypothetical protein
MGCMPRHPHSRGSALRLAEILIRLEPTEQFVANLKHWLCEVARRTTEDAFNIIGPILNAITRVGCANNLANVGYDKPHDDLVVAI